MGGGSSLMFTFIRCFYFSSRIYLHTYSFYYIKILSIVEGGGSRMCEIVVTPKLPAQLRLS